MFGLEFHAHSLWAFCCQVIFKLVYPVIFFQWNNERQQLIEIYRVLYGNIRCEKETWNLGLLHLLTEVFISRNKQQLLKFDNSFCAGKTSNISSSGKHEGSGVWAFVASFYFFDMTGISPDLFLDCRLITFFSFFFVESIFKFRLAELGEQGKVEKNEGKAKNSHFQKYSLPHW